MLGLMMTLVVTSLMCSASSRITKHSHHASASHPYHHGNLRRARIHSGGKGILNDALAHPHQLKSPTTTNKYVNEIEPPAAPSLSDVKLTVNITAIFEIGNMDELSPVFEKAMGEIAEVYSLFEWSGSTVIAMDDMVSMVTRLCAHFEEDKSMFRLLIVFGRVQTVQTVNLLSEALGIPVIGYMTDKGNGYVQVHNPLYLSLQPSSKRMARGLVSLMAVNYWHRLTMITQEEIRHDGFHRTFRELTEGGKWYIEDEVFISRRASDAALATALIRLNVNSSRIFLLHATASLTRRIFQTANRLLRGRFAWIITENAYSLDEDVLRDFPLGTKAFLINYDMRTEELLRDIMDFISVAFQKDGTGESELLNKLVELSPASSSSLSSSVLSPLGYFGWSSNGRNKARGCWSVPKDRLLPNHDPVYSALLSTQTYGLTGMLQFDDEGFLNISRFRVRNLVHDGRQPVWQDIGCVQGKEVRPFGIIWPGDAKRLEAQTEGKKRYRVVTNPVQPFVMTEAPHVDYGECYSDTPCLNLTNKYKSQDVVWEAIEAYEQGAGFNSSLFTIQCCRGLTIDLLNQLAADLDFEFTLYIVQDEKYGSKYENGTWTGIMRDLIDNTAHFAVAAFSITSQREIAIDFTYPYFFSGFSILYSDRTRETSLFAFLEPFSTEVWFAILVSAYITAIFMALFEWNSPFGLNPWGRKRNKNYSLASGLTMVFSVLFGHTVKTKSPKAWPSKVMQNFWAGAAIFIIASYTANLAAFIAGKHAGINYIDIQDPRLTDIKIGVLPGSAVHEVLKNSGSKLVAVAESNPVTKTDEGIKLVIKGRLDALLGDYPILDYARAHLAPSCELKLISKIFGDDRYGLGVPKQSSLKAALSKKIAEYHDNGYIDDLTDVHFADAHCFKRRISEEDSQLEVTHHAGLFVMLCVGVGVSILVLVLEHVIYKFLVPYIRQCPPSSRWRSVHLMFFSQRLQRIINCAELVSPQASMREMLGIVKKRQFARLFQKSTIRRNRLADIAKTKRLNRNFCDIVEKAKWLQDMKDNGLMDDDVPSTPTIIEIPLKQLTVNVELGASCLNLHDSPGSKRKLSSCLAVNLPPLPPPRTTSQAVAAVCNDDSASSSAESDDSLLGGSKAPSDKSLPNLHRYPSYSNVLPPPSYSSLTVIPGSLPQASGGVAEASSFSGIPTRSNSKPERSYRRRRQNRRKDMASSPELDLSGCSSPLLGEHSISPSRQRSLSTDDPGLPSSTRNGTSHLSKHRASPSGSLSSATLINEIPQQRQRRKSNRTPSSSSTMSRVRFSDSLPNGSLIQADSETPREEESVDPDSTSEIDSTSDSDSAFLPQIRPSLPPSLPSRHPNLLKTLSDQNPYLAEEIASKAPLSNTASAATASSYNGARTKLHKPRSYQDHLYSVADSGKACGGFSDSDSVRLETVTKKELLMLWKSSEFELTRKLESALQEKSRLEKRLALLQKQSPV